MIFDASSPLELDALHTQALELMLRRAGLRTLSLTPAIEPNRLGRALRALEPGRSCSPAGASRSTRSGGWSTRSARSCSEVASSTTAAPCRTPARARSAAWATRPLAARDAAARRLEQPAARPPIGRRRRVAPRCHGSARRAAGVAAGGRPWIAARPPRIARAHAPARYRPVDPHASFPELEERGARALARARRVRRVGAPAPGAPQWGFYEGPPTANGPPGTHHVLSRVFKDIFPRYRTMRGLLRRAQGRLGLPRPAGRARGRGRARVHLQGRHRALRDRRVQRPVPREGAQPRRGVEPADRADRVLGRPRRRLPHARPRATSSRSGGR